MSRGTNPFTTLLKVSLLLSTSLYGCSPPKFASQKSAATPPQSSSTPYVDYKELEEVVGGESKSPMLDVVFQHKGRTAHALLLVDTGSNYTVVSKAFAKRLGLSSKTSTVFNAHTKAKAPLAHVDRLTICGSKFTGEVLVADDSLVRVGSKLTDGILGADILSHTVFVLDAPRKRLFITSARWTKPSGMAVALSSKKLNEYDIDVKINGKRKTVLLDTGSWKTTLIRKDVPARSKKVKDSCVTMETVDKQIDVCDVLVNMQIGALQLPNMPVAVVPNDQGGTLGMDVLSSRLVVMDFHRKKLYFDL